MRQRKLQTQVSVTVFRHDVNPATHLTRSLPGDARSPRSWLIAFSRMRKLLIPANLGEADGVQDVLQHSFLPPLCG